VLGWITRKPITEDYVPLLPWLGVLWWGLAAGQRLLSHQPQWLQGDVPKWLQPLAYLLNRSAWLPSPTYSALA